MAYSRDKWIKRFKNRSDITLTLTHLTREQKVSDEITLSSVDVLLKILKEKRIIGSSGKGFIIGDNPAVCFQDAPLYGIGQNILHEKEFKKELGGKVRYSFNGLIFKKKFVYNKGGRPVFYEKLETAKSMLPKEEWWRIVSHNLEDDNNIVDWTHEREWRVKGDFDFALSKVYVLLGSTEDYKEFMEKVDDETLKNIAGITAISPMIT